METGNKLTITATKNYRNSQKIKDEQFKVDEIGKYELVLSLSDRFFKCSVADIQKGRCLFFDHFEFTTTLSLKERLEQLKIIFEEHEILQAGFWKNIKFLYDHEAVSFLPKTFFKDKSQKELLNFEFPDLSLSNEDVSSFEPNAGLVCSCFYIPSEIKSFLQQYYPKKEIQFFNPLTCILEGISNTNSSGHADNVTAHFEANKVTLIIHKKSRLHFLNGFKFESPEDAVYYTLLTLENCDLNPKNVALHLSGDVVHDSPIRKKLYQYIEEINYVERPKLLYYNYLFDEIPSNWHFETFSAYLCK